MNDPTFANVAYLDVVVITPMKVISAVLDFDFPIQLITIEIKSDSTIQDVIEFVIDST